MMTSTRNRYFLIASVLFLLVGVAVGLVAFYGGLPGGLSRRGEPDELRYLPKATAVVAYMNVPVVMRSDVVRKMRSVGSWQSGQDEFKDRTGIDMEHDVDRLVAGFEPQAGRESTALLLARGRFDQQKIEAVMKARGGDLAVTFLDSGLAAIGSTDMVRQALDRPKSRENATDNQELMDLVHGLATADAWVAGRFDALRGDARLPEGLASQIPAITWFTASAQVDTAIRGTVRVDAKDDEAATSLKEVIRGFVGLAKLQSGSRPELRAVADSLQLGGTGRTVVLSLTVPSETVDAMSQPRK